jgi:integrase
MEGFEGAFVTRCALRLAPLVFTRPGELRKAEWSEIDLEAAQWVIPAERMKMRQAHLVPLSSQAVGILRELHALTGRGRYVFPGARTNGRPMSENAVLAALRRMGYEKDEMTGHGFRAMARTILDEVLGSVDNQPCLDNDTDVNSRIRRVHSTSYKGAVHRGQLVVIF